jgi:hypothetical protein
MQVQAPNHRWTRFLIAGTLVSAAVAARADDVDRIREKAAELDRAVVRQEFEYAGEGKESNLARIYEDFGDDLLEDNKTETIASAAAATSDPAAKGRLERTHGYLMGERIFSAVAAGWDNARNYDRSAALTVAGSDAELTLNSYESMLANEENRSNRRNWYLASRDLRENSNVFLLNLAIDLDRHAQRLVGNDYDTYLAERYEIDPSSIDSLAREVLESTQAEYEQLLNSVVPVAIPEMTVSELREYDIPYLLRMTHLDETFPDGKYGEVAQRWLSDIGFDSAKTRNLKIADDAHPRRPPKPGTFPVGNGADTGISILKLGGFGDYWNLFGQLGSALFYCHIDPELDLADQRIGSPVIPLIYGALFQNVLTIPQWRQRYLQESDPAQVEAAVAFRNLLDLRESAARYVFYRRIYADSETPPSAYAETMRAATLWHQGATEESDYLLADDMHESGMKLIAAVRAAQLRQHLEEQFGAAWWSSPEAGAWLKSEWAKGFQHSPQDLADAWGLGAASASALVR